MSNVLDENCSENRNQILCSVIFSPPKMVPFSVGYEKKLRTRPIGDSNKRHRKVSITKSILQYQDFVKKNLLAVFISILLVSDGSSKAIKYKNMFVRSLSMAAIHGCQICPLTFRLLMLTIVVVPHR